MIEPILRLESDGFLAGGNSSVPRAQFEVSAAEQVVGFRGWCVADLPLQRFKSLIDTSGGKKIFW